MKRRTLVSIFFCLGVTFAAMAPMIVRAASVYELNADGVRAFASGDYEVAVDLLRQAHRMMPQDETLRQNLVRALNGWAVDLGEKELYDEALARLQEARRLDPDAPTVRTNLAVLRINQATSQIRNGHYAAAEQTLNQAVETAGPAQLEEINDRRATLYYLRGRDERAAGRSSQAETWLKQSLQAVPTYVPAMLELGDLLYRRGDNVAALDYYTEALELEPGRQDLAALIDKIMRESEVEQQFKQRSNEYFTVSYEGRIHQQYTVAVLQMLWQARREIGRELDAYPGEKIPVVLYQRSQYQTATIAPDWSGALYDGKIRIPVPDGDLTRERRERLRETLYHEYAHALLHETAPRVSIPVWLNEGIASYFELDRSARRERDQEDREWLARRMKQAPLPAIADLPAAFTSIDDAEEAEQAYRLSRCFVSWLAGRYRTTWLRSLVQELSEGSDIQTAFRKVYGRDLATLEKAWLDDLRRQ